MTFGRILVSGDRVRTIPLSALLMRMSRLMVDELIERLQAAGYDDQCAAHHPVFESIDPDGTRLTVLAARAGMTHQSMGELVLSMERLGYVVRKADPADGRARLVKLTRTGRDAVRRAVREIADIERIWLERFRSAGFDIDLRGAVEAALSEVDAERDAAGPS